MDKFERLDEYFHGENVASEDISPNTVADVAYELGLNLTSEEIVEYSNNY